VILTGDEGKDAFVQISKPTQHERNSKNQE